MRLGFVHLTDVAGDDAQLGVGERKAGSFSMACLKNGMDASSPRVDRVRTPCPYARSASSDVVVASVTGTSYC